jgi:hypothetical protein
VPPATGLLSLIVVVQATRVRTPTFNYTCFLETWCLVRSARSPLF